MRASKTDLKKKRGQEVHISGAEGIFSDKRVYDAIRDYAARGLTHEKGRPDTIVLTIERISRKPKNIRALPVVTAQCDRPDQAAHFITDLLQSSGISLPAVKAAFSVLKSDQVMRGASLIFANSGKRCEPDRMRGVRASLIGITPSAEKKLSAQLKAHGINTPTVREALILASKIASCDSVIAELCISDDPGYTTGYVSSEKLGYVRVPNIKPRGSGHGGRVFFLKERSRINQVIRYLEETSVILSKVSVCRGIYTIDEILDRSYQ